MKKSIVVMVVGLLIAVPLSAQAFPAKKGDKPCAECHMLDKKAAEAIVKKIVPTATVTNVKLSPVKGVWQIEFDAGEGKRGTFGLDFSKKYLVQFASVEDVVKQQKPQPPRKVDMSKIPLSDAITVGAATAAKKVIVFTDPDCPYCRQLHTIMKQVVAKRSDIAFVLIMNPLPMHKDILDDAFAGKAVPEPAASCTADAVERSKALANSLQFNGTPTLVRDDGLVLSGFLPEEKLVEWIDKKQ
jgi:thiol:disulfide interchange protein DsbC